MTKFVLILTLAVCIFVVPTVSKGRPAPAKAKEELRVASNIQWFIAIGRCEQPGDGKWGIDWDNPGPTYPGGLGVFAPLWAEGETAGLDLAPAPYRATPLEQMVQAQRIIDKYGIWAWGCTGLANAQIAYDTSVLD